MSSRACGLISLSRATPRERPAADYPCGGNQWPTPLLAPIAEPFKNSAPGDFRWRPRLAEMQSAEVRTERILAESRAQRLQRRWWSRLRDTPVEGSRGRALELFQHDFEWAALMCQYLRSTFGWDPTVQRVEAGGKAPANDQDWRRFTDAKRTFECALNGVCAIVVGAAGQSSGVCRDLESAFTWWMSPVREFEADWPGSLVQYVRTAEAAVWQDGVDWLQHHCERVQEDALIRYVGALHSGINLGRNRRLARSLNARTRHEQSRELAERLPDAVYQALRDGHVGDSPRAVLRRATLLLEHDANPRRRYRPRSRGLGSDGRDPAQQPWPVPPHVYDPSETVVALLADGLSPQVVDQALRSVGMGTLDESSARVAYWMPELGRDLDGIMSRRPWERFEDLEEFVNREEAEAALREPFIEEETANLIEEWRRTARLTPREAEILKLQESGLTRAEIEAHLGIAASTLRVHRKNIGKKLKPRA